MRKAADRTPPRRRVRLGEDGVALIEFALVTPLLLLLFFNLFDFSTLLWASMQVDNAAQMGAQAAYVNCNASTPAKQNCAQLGTVVGTAITSTSLGSNVALASGYPAEGYYCVSGTTLQLVASYDSTPPSDCSAYGSAAGVKPGDYIKIQVTYTYNPAFSGLSLLSSRTLTAQSFERLN